MNDREIRKQILSRLTVPLWPVAGRALGLGRSAAYQAARTGKIKTIDTGTNKKPVPTAFLREMLGLTNDDAA